MTSVGASVVRIAERAHTAAEGFRRSVESMGPMSVSLPAGIEFAAPPSLHSPALDALHGALLAVRNNETAFGLLGPHTQARFDGNMARIEKVIADLDNGVTPFSGNIQRIGDFGSSVAQTLRGATAPG